MKRKFKFTLPTFNLFCVGGTLGLLIRSYAYYGFSKGTLFILALFLFQTSLLFLQIHNYNAIFAEKEDKDEKPEIKRAFGERPIPPPSKSTFE